MPKTRGDVSWHLPKRGGGYAARPFAYSTRAQQYLIEVLADEGLTWLEIADRIIYDPEAKAIAQAFVDAGYGDVQAYDMVRRTA